MKKVISIILTICLLSISVVNTVFATESSVVDIRSESRKEEILKDYREKLFAVELSESDDAAVYSREKNSKSKFDLKLEIQAEAVEELKKAGYDAYDVNPQTFDSVGELLNTDLTEAGLSEDGAYLIVLNEESFIYPDAATSDPFTHTYNGTTYNLRWMTVRASDDPAFEKYTYKNVLNDNSRDVIMNCLDAALGIYVGAIWEPLGTVSSILGLSISDFWSSYDAYLIYNATSTWTRRYTQVWDNYYGAWAFGCFVEEVEAASYFNGWYYNSSSHSKQQLVTPTVYRTIYSDKFDDWDWRKNYAVLGYLYSDPYGDITDDVEYYYDGDAIITHRHNF